MSKVLGIIWRKGRRHKARLRARFVKSNFYGEETVAALLFLAPSLIGISVFFLIPFVDTVRRSFMDVRAANFIGLESYVSVLNNAAFRLAAANTLKFVAVCIPLLMIISLAVALLLRSVRTGETSSRFHPGRFYKTTFLLPMAVNQ